ncbi:MAG: hypothetical protein ACI4T9_07815 [Prevotella sp.]
MRTYIKPTIKVKTMQVKESMLAASNGMNISGDPAEKPSQSKSYFDMGSTMEAPTTSASSSIWEE